MSQDRCRNGDFAIGFLPSEGSQDVFGESCRLGEIVIGRFREQFAAPVAYWKPNEYERQWVEGIERILRQHESSCLVTAMRDPKHADHISVWPLYRAGNVVYVQNHIVVFSELRQPFDGNAPYASIRERETLSDDGAPISEWTTQVSVLRRFLHRLTRGYGSSGAPK
jgi:hypothetical protein